MVNLPGGVGCNITQMVPISPPLCRDASG